MWTWKEKILKQKPNNYWYLPICVLLNWNKKIYKVHRLVMLAFHWPSDLQVNHKNWIKSDNKLENLEYCTQSENLKHRYRVLWQICIHKWKFWKDHPKSIEIKQFTKEWKFIKKWGSSLEIQRELWFAHQNITACCRWEIKSSRWYKWEFKI